MGLPIRRSRSPLQLSRLLPLLLGSSLAAMGTLGLVLAGMFTFGWASGLLGSCLGFGIGLSYRQSWKTALQGILLGTLAGQVWLQIWNLGLPLLAWSAFGATLAALRFLEARRNWLRFSSLLTGGVLGLTAGLVGGLVHASLPEGFLLALPLAVFCSGLTFGLLPAVQLQPLELLRHRLERLELSPGSDLWAYFRRADHGWQATALSISQSPQLSWDRKRQLLLNLEERSHHSLALAEELQHLERNLGAEQAKSYQEEERRLVRLQGSTQDPRAKEHYTRLLARMQEKGEFWKDILSFHERIWAELEELQADLTETKLQLEGIQSLEKRSEHERIRQNLPNAYQADPDLEVRFALERQVQERRLARACPPQLNHPATSAPRAGS